MLYLFHGSDIAKSAEKTHTLINSLRAKKTDAAFVAISAENWNPAAIEENLGGQGLFSNKYIVFLDRVTDAAEAKEVLGDFIPAMNESTNVFIVLEGKLNAELKKLFAKHATKSVESEERAVIGKKVEINIFALGDAFGARDSHKAWMIYRQAIDSGLEPENVAGTLFWQMKSISLAARANTAAEAGLNPFVYSKAKKYAGNYSATELSGLESHLIQIYHDSHRGMTDLELGLEKLILGV